MQAEMAGWWQQGYDQQWDESWQAPPPPGKGKSKKGQGQGKKGKGKWQQPSEEQEATTTEHTGRIMSKYQFAHALLRAAADDEGSALVKLKKGMDDLAFLAARHLKTLVTNQNHHLLRRPGVGVSEAAASLQAGANMLENMKELNLDAVSAFLLDPDVKQALATLNTRDSTATRNAATMAEAIETLQKAVGKSEELEETAIKITIMASRLYLLGAHLLPLRAGLADPAWWAEQVPDGLSTNAKFREWKRSPKDKRKMQRALAAVVMEKIEEASGAGSNDAAALFGRSLAASAEEGSSESAAQAPKKKKKDKKQKKKKSTSSSETASAATTKGKKASKETKKSKGKAAEKKKRSLSSSQSSASSKAAPKTTEKAPKKQKKERQPNAESVSSSPEVLSSPKDKKAKKETDAKRKSKKGEESLDRGTVKVRRVSGLTPDSRIVVKEDDRYDEVGVKSAAWTLQELLEELLTANGDGEDLSNWTVKVLEDGKCKPVAIDTTPAALHPEVVLVRKGG